MPDNTAVCSIEKPFLSRFLAISMAFFLHLRPDCRHQAKPATGSGDRQAGFSSSVYGIVPYSENVFQARPSEQGHDQAV